MHDPSLLAHLVLGYSAVIDRKRAVPAMRLTVFPDAPDAAIDGSAVLQVLSGTIGASDSGTAAALPLPAGPVRLLVHAAGEGLLRALLESPPVPQVAVLVPAFLAADAGLAPILSAWHAAGGLLGLDGQPREPLPAAVAKCFALRVLEPGVPAGPGLPLLRASVRAGADLEAAFGEGAVGGIGWPFGAPPTQVRRNVTPAGDLRVIMELINRVEREEPIDRLEAVVKNDPTLAFRLLRYINSPGFGLSVEVSSFRHALMMLGYQRLKRWLSLLLASAGKSADRQPLLHAAVRRGLLMEELARGSDDAEMRGEIFICGVFSLLDRLLDQPMADLMGTLPVPQRVRQALLDDDGPFAPYLQLACAVEQESAVDIREAEARLMLGQAELNRALLSALAAAARFE